MSLASDHALARTATIEAGAIAMRFFRQAHERWEKGPGQVVTEADIAVDRFLKERLVGQRPAYGWLSEESEDDPARLGRPLVWIVDPIDGTRSFAEGLPEFTISVALVADRRAVVGIVLNPATGELFEAMAGGGARLNGRPIMVSPKPALAGARIVASRFESRRWNFPALLPAVELTTIGSLAYKLALVAAGRHDGYLSWRRANDWDIAGAAAILTEAGGLLTDAEGGSITLNQPDPTCRGLLAAGPTLHAQLQAATQAAWRRSRAGRA